MFHPELSLLYTIYHVAQLFFEIVYKLSYFYNMKNSKSKESNNKVSNLIEVPSSFPPYPLKNGHFLLHFVYAIGNNLQYTGKFRNVFREITSANTQNSRPVHVLLSRFYLQLILILWIKIRIKFG